MEMDLVAERGLQPPAAVSVRDYRNADAQRWERYVDDCAQSTFFHRIGWRGIFEQEFGHRTHYLIAERHSTVVGVLPLTEIKSRLFGHSLASLPFCAYGGTAADDSTVSDALIEAAQVRGRELRVDHVELRNQAQRRPDWPRNDIYVMFRKPIETDVDANLMGIPRKQRAMVRKGEKHGLQARIDSDSSDFFALYSDNMHRQGTPPFSRRYFERLRATFGDDCELMTVVDERHTPVSTVLSFYFKDEVLPYYAGDTARSREIAGNDFKYWALMKRACERGLRWFDYGRSKVGTGSFDFKKNWGFTPMPLAYEYRLFNRDSVPQLNPLNPKYRALIATWKRLPRGVVNALGPHIVRSLG